jgi:protein-disulfide isomerase
VFYLGVVGAGVGASLSASARRRALFGRCAFGLAIFGLLYSLYMAFIAFVVLNTVCLLCAALYLVSIGLFPAAWFLRRQTQVVGKRRAAERAGTDRYVVGASVAIAALVLVAGTWETLRGGAGFVDAETVKRDDPEFYSWYFSQPVVTLENDSDRAVGAADATVTIVEFSDFECGHCAKFDETLEFALRAGPALRVIFRHFPLDSSCNPGVAQGLHPAACLAAVAAECSREQGRFWEYKKLLFENQKQLGREFLIGYARRLNMDEAAFVSCLGSEEMASRVKRDASDGVALGIESTPTLFINGRLIRGALSAEHLLNAIALAEQGDAG